MSDYEDITSDQLLSFTLREEQYAVEINKVREVLDVAVLTTVPRMPEYLAGVINLRGAVVPVIDLGLKLGMEPTTHSVNTCIIIIDIKIDDECDEIQMGVLTDGVQSVMHLNHDDIEPLPKIGINIDTSFIKGMGRVEDNFLILLDLDRALKAEGEAAFDGLAAGSFIETASVENKKEEMVTDKERQ